MTFVCNRCLKVKDAPDPPGYEDMDIIDKFNAWRGMDHAICADCVREILGKEPLQASITEATDVK